MTNLEKITFAHQMMFATNKAHNSTYGIFIDPHMNLIDESIEFDVLASNMEHVTQLCSLLNLTLHIEANSDPSSDKKINYYII